MPARIRLHPKNTIGYHGIRTSRDADRFHYQVTGTGKFPEDMLRYDSAEYQDDKAKATAEVDEQTAYCGPPRTLAIVAKGCTPERWRSFGWYVQFPVEEHKQTKR